MSYETIRNLKVQPFDAQLSAIIYMLSAGTAKPEDIFNASEKYLEGDSHFSDDVCLLIAETLKAILVAYENVDKSLKNPALKVALFKLFTELFISNYQEAGNPSQSAAA